MPLMALTDDLLLRIFVQGRCFLKMFGTSRRMRAISESEENGACEARLRLELGPTSIYEKYSNARLSLVCGVVSFHAPSVELNVLFFKDLCEYSTRLKALHLYSRLHP